MDESTDPFSSSDSTYVPESDMDDDVGMMDDVANEGPVVITIDDTDSDKENENDVIIIDDSDSDNGSETDSDIDITTVEDDVRMVPVSDMDIPEMGELIPKPPIDVVNRVLGNHTGPVYHIIADDMGCCWYIRRKDGASAPEYLFVHSDDWGQYTYDCRVIIGDFIRGFKET